MTVGERIKNARLTKEMTQKQVADACGMADSAIRKYESGKIMPTLKTLQRIAKALDADIVYLISGQTSAEVEQGIVVQAEAEAKYYTKPRFAEAEAWKTRIDEIGKDMAKLNDEGQLEAVKRVRELTEISRYQYSRQPSPFSAGIKVYGDGPAGSFPPAPQSTPDSTKGTDTTSPADGSEEPPKGK